MSRVALSLLSAVLLGCCGVSISPASNPSKSFPQAEFVAKTFWYSNDKSVANRRMLRAMTRHCRKPIEAISHGALYGLHGSWFTEFSCSQDASQKPPAH